MPISASLQRDESGGDVAAGVVPLGQRLVVLVEGADFEHLREEEEEEEEEEAGREVSVGT